MGTDEARGRNRQLNPAAGDLYRGGLRLRGRGGFLDGLFLSKATGILVHRFVINTVLLKGSLAITRRTSMTLLLTWWTMTTAETWRIPAGSSSR